MFRDIGAPIQAALPSQTALFDTDMVEGVFACSEAAFDYEVLRKQLAKVSDLDFVRTVRGFGYSLDTTA